MLFKSILGVIVDIAAAAQKVGNVVVVVQLLDGGEIRALGAHEAHIMRGRDLEVLLLGVFCLQDPLAFVTPGVARGASAVREDGSLRVEPSETDLTEVISIAVQQDEATKDIRHDAWSG
jgi:hypothetical protein